MADNVNYEVLVQEGSTQVSVDEPANIVTVDPDDPGLVSIALAGVVTSHTSLLAVWAHPDNLTTRVGQGRFYFPVAATLLGVSATVAEVPVGDDIVVDIHIGTPGGSDESIFTDQDKRVVIPDGLEVATETTDLDISAAAKGQYLRADIDQVGSTTPGAHLTVTVRYRIS